MRRICVLVLLAMMAVPALMAQETHVGVGAFFDYFRWANADQNFFGLGGRFAVNPHPNVGIEAEAAYYFRRSVGSLNDNAVGTISLQNPQTRIVPALLGFTVHNNGPVRVFVTAKAGILHFGTRNFSGLGGFFDRFGEGTTRGAFYPGGGIELGSGNIGLRVEAGDLMYFLGGAQHNLRFTVGPQFRF
jgi:hypothetical protein